MNPKLPLPAQFSDGMFDYSLVYFPGLPAGSDPRYSVEPNVGRMTPTGRNAQQVNVAGKGRMILSWVMMQLPPVPGTTQPARNYLFFRLSEKPIPFELLHPGNMICYAAVPKHIVENPAQGFVDGLFGMAINETEAVRKRDSWAQDLFAAPAERSEERPVNREQENEEENEE